MTVIQIENPVRHQQRRGIAAQWSAADPTLGAGEIGVETDTGRMKVGDDATAWTALPYIDDRVQSMVNLGDGVHMNGALRQWRYADKAIKDVCIFGDSLTGVSNATDGWAERLRRRFNNEINRGDAGFGFFHGWRTQWSYEGDWLDMPSDAKDDGIMVTKYTGTAVSDGGPGDVATFTPPAGSSTDLIDLYWIDGGLLVFGNFRVSKDGGSTWSQIDSISGHTRVGSNNLVKTTITGPITGSFKIQASSNGSNSVGVAFAGVSLRSSSVTHGIRIHEFGAGGRYQANLTRTTTGSPLAMLTTPGFINPDLCVFLFSNDVLLHGNATTFKTRYQAILLTLALAELTPDVILVCPPEQGGNRAGVKATQALFRAVTHEVADETNAGLDLARVAVLDLGEAWGEISDSLAAGLMDDDEIHPSEAGHAYIADQVARMLA